MGLSFSRSVKFGAVRFNFSGSGIGMSVGIPGLRIGTGPRGAYISGGMGGFRYRKSLNARQPVGGACPNFCVNGVWVTPVEGVPRTEW